MIFIYKKWDKFCYSLYESGKISIPACKVNKSMQSFIVLKHDIENSVSKALRMAMIEAKYGHKGTYYVHAHILKDKKNLKILKKIQELGHEVSYHHDVMDSNKGDIDNALEEFCENKKLFECNGFLINTVCQHGNPVIERIGYASNRDFFRNSKVQDMFPDIADIMVNYKSLYNVDYSYYSDAGRKFKSIYDPINNDIINSDEKNVSYNSLDELLNHLDKRAIISTHPHRWTAFALPYLIKNCVFKIIKFSAKIMMKIPFLKKVMSKYYFIAKYI